MSKLNLRGLGEPVRITKGGKQLFFNCPLCGDTRGRLGVLLTKKIFNCFNCGSSGRVEDLQRPLDKFKDDIERFLGKGEDNVQSEKEEGDRLFLPPEWEPVTHKCGLPYRYLRKREVTDREIEKYSIGYCGSGTYAERIVIPIFKEEDRTLRYLVGRAYTNRTPKYLNAGISKDHLIFKTFKGKVKEAIICEGIFDALRIGKLKPAIALLGKVINNYGQLQEIVKSTDKAYMMLDNDAQREGFIAANALNYFIPTQVMFLEKKDPGSMNTKELREVLPR